MALSYVDIAKYLGKSPNTIKNQVRQINMKSDLFNYTVDNEIYYSGAHEIDLMENQLRETGKFMV